MKNTYTRYQCPQRDGTRQIGRHAANPVAIPPPETTPPVVSTPRFGSWGGHHRRKERHPKLPPKLVRDAHRQISANGKREAHNNDIGKVLEHQSIFEMIFGRHWRHTATSVDEADDPNHHGTPATTMQSTAWSAGVILGALPEIKNGYVLRETIGFGSFAVVRRCVRLADQKVCAVKVFEKSMLRRVRNTGMADGRRLLSRRHTAVALDKVYSELKLMEKLAGQHSNLVTQYGWYDDEKHDKIYMFMEFVSGGTVMTWHDESRRYSCRATGGACGVHRSVLYVNDIANGLSYLHAYHIAHRDIKPENVLLTAEGRCKITDLGVARHFAELDSGFHHSRDHSNSSAHLRAATLQKSSSRGMVRCTEGTYAYWAPEMLSEQPFNAMACDVWALGVCFYNFLTTKLPFHSDISIVEMFDAIEQAELDLDELALSFDRENELRILTALLERDVAKRTTLYSLITDPWLKTTVADVVRRDRLSVFRKRHGKRLSSDEFCELLRQTQHDEEPRAPTADHMPGALLGLEQTSSHVCTVADSPVPS